MQFRTHHQPTNTFSSACCQSSDMQICHLSRRLLPIPIHPSLKSVSIYIVSQISNQCSSFHQLLEALLLCNSVHGVPSVSSHTSTRVHTRCAQCKFTPNAKAGAQCVSDRCADRINKPNAKAGANSVSDRCRIASPMSVHWLRKTWLGYDHIWPLQEAYAHVASSAGQFAQLMPLRIGGHAWDPTYL